jgi:type II restriction/modification system DNA methylase subunit YeeA
LVVVAKDDDTTLGILQSRFHAAWALRLGTSLEDRPRYTSSTTFRTFPFPEGLTPNLPASEAGAAIGRAAARLNDLREKWLRPPELVKSVPEIVPGYPDRRIPVSAKAAAELKPRTLTNLYNHHPDWLQDAHNAIDAAVAKAYGWAATISEEESLAQLLELNLARPAQVSATGAVHGAEM